MQTPRHAFNSRRGVVFGILSFSVRIGRTHQQRLKLGQELQPLLLRCVSKPFQRSKIAQLYCSPTTLAMLVDYINLFKFRKSLPLVGKRSRHGLKAQQAPSPGHRPGWVNRRECALKGQKRLKTSVANIRFCPCRAHLRLSTYPGRCPGLRAFAPPGRALNASSQSNIL